MSRFFTFCVLALCSSLSWSQSLVVSTHPIYLIAEEITQGIEQPVLLLADQSGHDITLTPAHRKAIFDASLVIWLGKAHEAPLDKLLSNNPKAISILSNHSFNRCSLGISRFDIPTAISRSSDRAASRWAANSRYSTYCGVGHIVALPPHCELWQL